MTSKEEIQKLFFCDSNEKSAIKEANMIIRTSKIF